MMQRTVGVSLLAIVCLGLFGCATLPPNAKRDPRDPFERVNRSIYKFNDAVDRAVLKPVALGYQKITPRPVRTSVSNFLDNLGYTTTIVNDLLQLKFKPFFQDTGRLVVNTTVGIGGLFDPATRVGLQKNDEDFGQTLGHYGVHPGPYIVIPILGPSDVRDGLGRVADIFTDPRHYIKNPWISYGLWGLEVVDVRYRLLQTDKLVAGAYDKYAFLRNAYLQRRQYLVTDGQVPEKQQEEQQYEEEQKILEETEGGEPPPKGGSPDSGSPNPGSPNPNEASQEASPHPAAPENSSQLPPPPKNSSQTPPKSPPPGEPPPPEPR